MKITTLTLFIFATGMFILFVAAVPQDQKKGGPWNIPAEYKSKANPYKSDASLLKLGKNAYSKHCRSCHGNTGIGDGPMAKNLKTHPGDFSDAEFQKNHTDGELFYMSYIGRDEMPNFEKKITDEEERWAVINYLRSLKK
jgi:mono/diheme cytochrome c family protein